MNFRNAIRSIAPAWLVRCVRSFSEDLFSSLSYSQEGEDMVLKRLLRGRPPGFYVDVGAHHPMRFSNTHAFYRAGWRGINIDAQPGSMNAFYELRPEDINIEIAVSDTPGRVPFYGFSAPELNGLSPSPCLPGHAAQTFPLIETTFVESVRLSDILHQHVPSGKEIDFLTIDVEGHDLAVLRSNDWERFRPLIILLESHGLSFEAANCCAEVQYVIKQNYIPVAKTFNTIFLTRSDYQVPP